MKHLLRCILLVTVILLGLSQAGLAEAEAPVVHAVLFYSPTCPHCHQVIQQDLPPLVAQYGEALQIIAVNVTSPDGQALYQAAIEHYQVPPERQGVPTLVVGDTVLVGSGEIPAQFPGIVKEGLAAGGIAWPDIPGLEQALTAATQPTPAETPTPTLPTFAPTAVASPANTPVSPLATPTTLPTVTPPPTVTTPAPAVAFTGNNLPAEMVTAAPPSDPVGFTLAGLVLAGMIVSLVYAVFRLILTAPVLFRLHQTARPMSWAIPLLALLGLGVATYLAYVEINQVEAVCGPVGECNIVQASPYARLLGLPIAVWGILNYLAIGVLWGGQKYLTGRWAYLSALGLVCLTGFGVLFSIYLTCLELFVITAVCMWCLSSALITTVLLLLAVTPITVASAPIQARAAD